MFFLSKVICLYYPIICLSQESELCKYVVRSESKATNYFITGLFPIYSTATSRGMSNGLQYSEIMKFTLNEINKNSLYTIGYELYDTCGESQINITMGIITDMLLDSRYYKKKPILVDKQHIICKTTLISSNESLTLGQLQNNTFENVNVVQSHINLQCNETAGDAELSTFEMCECEDLTTQISKYRLGLVGAASSTVSTRIDQFLSVDNLAMISYASTSPLLSVKKDHPNFMRTIPSDTFQVQVLIDFILYFQWKYISVVASDNEYGRAGMDEFLDKSKQYELCIGKQIMFAVSYIDKEIENVVHDLKNDKQAEIIVLFTLTSASKAILFSSEQLQLHGRTWILTEGVVGIGTWINNIDSRVLEGAFSLSPYSGSYREFNEYFYNLNYRDVEENEFLKIYFHSKDVDESNHGNITLGNYQDNFNDNKVGFVRNAVIAYKYALDNYIIDTCRNTSCDQCYPPIANHQLFNDKYLKKVKFYGLLGEEVQFDENGDIQAPYYRILNMQKKSGKQAFLQVGEWINHTLVIKGNDIKWSNNNKPRGKCSVECLPGSYAIYNSNRKCCWFCLQCPEDTVKLSYGQNETCKWCLNGTLANAERSKCLQIGRKKIVTDSLYGRAIISLVMIGILSCAITLVTFIKFRDTMYVRAANMYVSLSQVSLQMLLFAVMLLMFTERSKLTCSLQLYSIGILLSIVFSIILIKTELLHRIFQCKQRLSIAYKRLTTKLQMIIIGTSCSTYIFLQIALFLLNVQVEIKELFIEEENVIIILCDFDHNVLATLLFLLFMSLVCGVQTYRTRKLPQLFNEASYIMYAVFISSLCMLLTTFLLMHGQNAETKLAMLYISIFTTNYLLLAVMYGNKLWIILFRPEKNDRRSMPVFTLKSTRNNTSIY